jgi:hypothetical protein
LWFYVTCLGYFFGERDCVRVVGLFGKRSQVSGARLKLDREDVRKLGFGDGSRFKLGIIEHSQKVIAFSQYRFEKNRRNPPMHVRLSLKRNKRRGSVQPKDIFSIHRCGSI